MPVTITHPDFRCVPTGGVHARHYPAGTIVDDPFVAAVALRNGWGVDETAVVPPAPNAPAPAGGDVSPPADPKPIKARRAAPENK